MTNILKMNGISLCMIVKNEEKHLDMALAPISDFVDEIIVVDTGSIDATKSIAEKYNAKIYDFEWIDDFSAARNFSFSKANYSKIIFIDADEVIQNPQELAVIKNNTNSTIGGWLVNLTSFAEKNDNKKDIYKNSLLRIVKNHPEIRFEGIIHEQILEPILNLGLKLEHSKIDILHYGYNLNEEEMRQKQLRNVTLLEKAIEINPNDSYNLYNLGKTYLALSNKTKALEILEKSIEIANKESAVYPQALNYSAVTAFQLNNNEKAKNLATKSLKVHQNQSFANFIMSEVLYKEENFSESLKYLLDMKKAILNPDLKSRIIGDYNIPSEVLDFKIGRLYYLINDLQNAEKYFKSCLNSNQNEINSILALANIKYKNQNYQETKDLINQALKIDPNKPEALAFLNEINQKEKISKMPNSISEIKKKLSKNSSQTPLITLSMIVKNEENVLEDCLLSVKDLVDEMVIVDTGSTDKTKDIIQKYSAKLYEFDWIGDFAAARNEALKHSTGKWILYLDADERIEPIDINKLRSILENAPNDLGALICTIESDHSNLTGTSELHRGGYPRLFKNLGYPKIHFKGRVHEQISPSLVENGLGMSHSDIVIKHLGYNRSREEMEKKLKRNYDLLLKHVNEEPTNGYGWYQLGQTLGQMQIRDKSEEAIKFAIKCGNLSRSVYASACSTLSQYCGQRKDYTQSLEWAEKSLELAPNQIYGLNLKAYSLLYLGRKKEAAAIFEEALKLKKQKQGVPQSGFDIMLDEKIILNGLKEARE